MMVLGAIPGGAGKMLSSSVVFLLAHFSRARVNDDLHVIFDTQNTTEYFLLPLQASVLARMVNRLFQPWAIDTTPYQLSITLRTAESTTQLTFTTCRPFLQPNP